MKRMFAVIAAAAVLSTAACNGDATDDPTFASTPSVTATQLPSTPAPAGTPTPSVSETGAPALCSPLTPPTEEEVKAALIKELQKSDTDYGSPKRVQVENFTVSYGPCDNRSAKTYVTYDVTYVDNGYHTSHENEPLTLNFCHGQGWVANNDLDCSTDF